MEIRRAIRADIPELVLLGEEFARVSQPVHGCSVSRERIIECANGIIEYPEFVGLVLIVEGKMQGFIMGCLQRIYFSEDVALQELAWYVRKGFKGMGLLDGFEKIARGLGCHHIIVGNKPAYFDLKNVYERRGYKLLETQYTKCLKG